MDLRYLISKLEKIENLKEHEVMEAAPTEFKPTHFHKNNFGGRLPVMLHSDDKFYHMAPGQYPNQNQKVIAPWNGNPENRSSLNPASIDGEFVDGKPVDYPEGVTYKTFNKEGQGARADGSMDTLPADNQNSTSNYTGQDQRTPEPSANKETDELAKDIATATKLLDKAEKNAASGSAAPAVMIESIYARLVESFDYVVEALSDLTPEEQKQLTDVISKLGPAKDQRPDIQTLVNRYMALQKSTEPAKEPAKEPSQSSEIPAEDPLLSPEDLKIKLARFKELLDKSLMREPEGQGPQVDPKRRIVPDPKRRIVPDPKKAEPEPEYTDPYGTDDAAMIMKYAGTARK